MGREYQLMPWDMRRLTIAEFDAINETHEQERKRAQALEQQIGGG